MMLPEWVFCYKNSLLHNYEGEFCKWSSAIKSNIMKSVPRVKGMAISTTELTLGTMELVILAMAKNSRNTIHFVLYLIG